jgi:hypothetical protein
LREPKGLETDGTTGWLRRFAVTRGARSRLARRPDDAPWCRYVGGHCPPLRTRRVAAAAGQSFLVSVHWRRDGHGLAFLRYHDERYRCPQARADAASFADYMQTPEFQKNLDVLIKLAKSERIAIMCAEAVPWHCHRSLISDALLARGIEVQEITSVLRTRPHTLTPWGEVHGTQITYPADTKIRAMGDHTDGTRPQSRRPR